MAHISRDEVLKIARISNIALHEQEVDAVVTQLQQVLTYAERVIDIAGNDSAEPITQLQNVFRPDVAVPIPTEPILAQAPEREERYFVVPKILENT
jgi:aspartyl-tRNA(Asn)/glutamyl-tRNA(Gln) amidotransferase subunit C